MTPEQIEKLKSLLPTSLGSDEIRSQVSADILRRSIFSARMTSAAYLAKVREVCAALSAGKISQADARAQLLAVLSQLGYDTNGPEKLTNPASVKRLNLILDTQRQMASSVSRLMAQTEATIHAFPAWELARLESRQVPRADWPARWRAAGNAVNWQGALQDRFIALKSSPIWTAIGNGTGGFSDALHNPYPPFAYSSGLGWLAVSREEAEKLGLLDGQGSGLPEAPSRCSISPATQDIKDAIARYGIPNLAEGLLA